MYYSKILHLIKSRPFGNKFQYYFCTKRENIIPVINHQRRTWTNFEDQRKFVLDLLSDLSITSLSDFYKVFKKY